ncbi:hypothetical protein [Brevibacterium jeotgali]|uniref:Magnesium transporter NIPA n=1 Tax=Brevibacterium jeotgali TaxID=1262550 RepID=A0A2H1L2I2_9MICO|nr:hypothetical protein [Brevibacterium jeotgali]TWC03084.1 hypothetical protein FB108_1794 [Brevibacterium jeotgali]SMY11107.1 hypothetical protein BJEO58_00689 [Brevibacterium jeotgali]
MSTFAISIAVIAALCLAVGTHLQHRAVAGAAVSSTVMDGAAPPSPRRLIRLLRSPLWVLGLGLLTLETGLNMVALGLAPVALVQPIGTLSLVAAVVLGNRAVRPVRSSGRRISEEGRVLSSSRHVLSNPRVLGGIGLTLLSTGLFVGVSAQWSTAPEAAASELVTLAFLLLGIAGLGAVVAMSAVGHATRVVAAGVLFGLVAAGAHALLHAFAGSATGLSAMLDSVAPVHIVLLIGLLAGSVVGIWIVQTAYASGPPETVLAGLTVMDPLTAVLVGAAVLGEGTAMPLLVVLVLILTGTGAVAGVLVLVRVHPAVVRVESSADSVPPSTARRPAPHPAAALHGARPADTRE